MEQEENISSKELHLVVLGAIQAGKTSLITSLLGKTDTQTSPVRTVNCIRHEGQLSGRKLTVVDTPGWWNGYDLIDTAQRTKHELLLSVRQCPPGPHAFILAIEVASFKDRNLRTVKEHLGLFGEHIWGHTALVFTKGESLKGRSIEEHIESEGEALKWLVEKCGNRYCVLDKQTSGQEQFLGIIERLVDSNSGGHFHLDDETLRDVEEDKRAAQERSRVRQEKVQEKRKHLQKKGVPVLPKVRIVMLGWVVSGKSAARNVILNKDKLASLSKTEQCESETALVHGRHITVVDTPGWWKYFSAQYTPDRVKAALRHSVSFGCKSPHALLLVVPADVSFLEEQRKITEDNMKRVFGEMAWKHTIVLFTWGDSLGSTRIEEHIESEGEHLRWLVEKCGNRYQVFDNVNRADVSQVQQLLEKIDELEASFDIYDLTQGSSMSEITQSCEKDTEKPDMLDKEWSRRDRELEERIRRLWQETFDSAMRGDRSSDFRPDFCGNEDSPDNGKVDLPQGNSSVPAHPSEHCLPHHGLPHPTHSNFDEKEIKTMQREWRRYKVLSGDRVRGFLFPVNAPGIQAEHERQRHGSRELEEWARHGAVVMETFETIISELCPESVSEPGEEERKQSDEKVLMWKTTLTSDLGSELDPEDNDTTCAE